MFGCPRLTLNEGPKVKSNHTKRFPAHDFLCWFTIQTSRTNNKRVISTFKFGYACLILKERPKVKSDHTRRFSDHDFLHVGLPFKTSRINNKQVISTFKFDYTHLTLKERPKVKSDHTKRFPAHGFLHVGLQSPTSRTNNKRVISTLNFASPRLTLNEGPKVKSDHTRRFPAHDSYMLVYHPKPLGPIISEFKAQIFTGNSVHIRHWYCIGLTYSGNQLKISIFRGLGPGSAPLKLGNIRYILIQPIWSSSLILHMF